MPSTTKESLGESNVCVHVFRHVDSVRWCEKCGGISRYQKALGEWAPMDLPVQAQKLEGLFDRLKAIRAYLGEQYGS